MLQQAARPCANGSPTGAGSAHPQTGGGGGAGRQHGRACRHGRQTRDGRSPAAPGRS